MNCATVLAKKKKKKIVMENYLLVVKNVMLQNLKITVDNHRGKKRALRNLE